MQPSDELYAKHSVVATNGIVYVEPNIPFRIQVANFGTNPKRLVKNQAIGELLPHPTLVVPTHVTFAEVLGLVNSDTEKTKPEPTMRTCAPNRVTRKNIPRRTMRKTTVQILFINTRLTS